MPTHLLSAHLIALIDIKVCGTRLWLPAEQLVSLDTPGTPVVPWRSVSKLLTLGLLVWDEAHDRGVLTIAGEKVVEPHRAALAATVLRHQQARALSELTAALA